MLRNKKGVSLITLIITIIVVIILAVIVMRGTGGTIEQANYSSYMDDLGKVKEAVKTKAMEVKGEYLIDGRVVSMEEIYHYVAKGGKTGEDFVGKANVPAYTIIDREKADIGIEIPTRNIESGTARNVQIQYIVTKEGEVFAWPPYEYEDKLYITENVTLAGKLDKIYK